MSHSALLSSVAVATLVLVGTAAHADQVINDDLIVTSSICVGFDCVNGEVFDFDTLRLKENNTRIKFMDTSNTAGFPANDWELAANESNSGGRNFLAIRDCGTGNITGQCGNVVFAVEANAPANALYVTSSGRVGLRTATPVLDLHIRNGNTPALRLEQDGSNGFTPQSWDLAGNEVNFFLRDVTGGSRLPFRVQPGAPSNSLFIAASGNVGMGTAAPGAPLDIRANSGTVGTGNAVLKLGNTNGAVAMQMDPGNDGIFWNFASATNNTFNISRSGTGGTEFSLTDAGNLTIRGGLVTGTAGSCTVGTPCDRVFDASVYTVPSIEEHAAQMWANQHLPAVGPTLPDQPINITRTVTRMLNELEHAHIYIEQLNAQLKVQGDEIEQLRQLMSVQ